MNRVKSPADFDGSEKAIGFDPPAHLRTTNTDSQKQVEYKEEPMKTQNVGTKLLAMAIALVMLTIPFGIDATAQQIECSSPVRNVSAVTNPAGHVITTRYQLDTPNLQPLLSTTIEAGAGCLVAHLSGQARITDNYVVFQVRVDGVPLEGQLPLPTFTTPVVFVSIDSGTANDDEQFIDPTKVVSYNFFAQVSKGTHTVEVLGAAGSNIVSPNFPTVTHLVLTLEYR
jgi:hypothetical protein